MRRLIAVMTVLASMSCNALRPYNKQKAGPEDSPPPGATEHKDIQVIWQASEDDLKQVGHGLLRVFHGQKAAGIPQHEARIQDFTKPHGIPALQSGETTFETQLLDKFNQRIHVIAQRVSITRDAQRVAFGPWRFPLFMSLNIKGQSDVLKRMRASITSIKATATLDGETQVFTINQKPGIEAGEMMKWFQAEAKAGGCVDCHRAEALDFSKVPFASKKYKDFPDIMRAALERVARRDERTMPPPTSGFSRWSQQRIEQLVLWGQQGFSQRDIPPLFTGSSAFKKDKGQFKVRIDFLDGSQTARMSREITQEVTSLQAMAFDVEVQEKEFPKPVMYTDVNYTLILQGPALAGAQSVELKFTHPQGNLSFETPLQVTEIGYEDVRPAIEDGFTSSEGGSVINCTICHEGSISDNGGLDLTVYPFVSEKGLAQDVINGLVYDRITSDRLDYRMPPRDYSDPWDQAHKDLLATWRDAGYPKEEAFTAKALVTAQKIALDRPYVANILVKSPAGTHLVHAEEITFTEPTARTLEINLPAAN